MSCVNGYPNIQNFDLESWEADAFLSGVGSSWCPSRCRAKGRAKALWYLRKWGLAYATNINGTEGCDIVKSEVKFDYKCGGCIVGSCGDYRSYSGAQITIQEGRELLSCEAISGAVSYSSSQVDYWWGEKNDTNGKEMRKAHCNAWCWEYISDFFQKLDNASQNEVACITELTQQQYDEAADTLAGVLDEMPEPMSNATLAAIIGGSGLAMILALNKFVK